MSNIRIRTTPNGPDQYIKIPIQQDFDFIEILSLNISQDKAYQNFCSDYGVIVGRVIINNGFGVPNARVSVFIPITDDDKNDPQISGLYPYETVNDKDINGIRYNLLPKESDNQNECYTPIGTFPAKREILDNEEMLDVYSKYYKFTSVTNHAGDFMIFGVPVGNYVVHVDADISNIGIASQRPYDLIDQGTPSKFFYSPTKFKSSKNLNSLVQVKSANAGVNVQPFWGDVDNCEIGINRLDIDLNYQIRPAAIFMGSLFGDSHKNSVNKRCRPRKKLGQLCEQVPREGTIEMIRKTIDNQIEQFDVEGGRVIDEAGAWAYQIPMNLDYVVTDEFGNLVPSEDPNFGVPTRSRVRFRISMDEGGGTGRLRTRGKYLVPHNPDNLSELDFNFGKSTNDRSFTDIYWNKIYSVKSFIAKTEKAEATRKSKTYTGIKDVDGCVGDKSPFPFNRTYTKNNILFTIVCFILTLITSIVFVLNKFLCWIRGIKIAGWRPFKAVKPISMVCPSDPQTSWAPGCNDTVEDYTDCVSAVLADQLDLFQFDFYNDWVNGTLYYYLLKYKKKRRGREKFCETYCDDYSGGTGSNTCKNNELADSTVNGIEDSFSHGFRNGLLVKYDNNLYYPPLLLDGSNMKLFPTDIVGLGSILDCDWQGFPKIIQYFTNTSYKIPPLIQEVDEEDGSIETGMIQIGSLYSGLFFDINCKGVSFAPRQATNIRRQCELNVDTPEVDGGAAMHATVTINEIYDTTDPVDVVTSVGKYIRDSFYLLNVSGSDINSYPPLDPTSLAIPSQGTSFEFDGHIDNPTHNNGIAYNNFRNFQFPQGGHPDMGFQAWGNSFYTYFGIIPGKTALDKLTSKYFTSCIPVVSDDFIIETTTTNATSDLNSDGSINFTFIGGTGPFRYIWTGINYDNGPFTASTSGQINNLLPETYTITATDSLGTTVIKDVTVDGPQHLTCGFTVLKNPSAPSATDGSIGITQLAGGTLPYNLTVSGPALNSQYSNVTFSNSPIQNLPIGTYILTVSDNSTPLQTCSQTIQLTSVAALALQSPIDIENISCNVDCDGVINPNVSGGQPPYSVSVNSSNGYTNNGPYDTTTFDNLCEGPYSITVTDSVGQTISDNVTLTKIIQPTINVNGINNSKQCNSSQYMIKFNIVAGSEPAPYTIIYYIDGVPSTQIANSVGQQTLLINQVISNNLTILIEDNQGCQSSQLVLSASMIQRPATNLSLGGSRVVNNITYSGTGGIQSYTYTPVDIGQTNVYTAPNSNPVPAIVTDSVGCTASHLFI